MSNIYLGIDVGSKTLGLAIGKHGFAFATTTLYFPEHDFDHASHQLLSYMKQEQINYLVIGYPKRLNNHKSSTTIMIEKFLAIIEQLLMIEQSDMPIKLWDERLTSKLASEILQSRNLKKHQQISRNHQLAAQLILQSFLDCHEQATILA